MDKNFHDLLVRYVNGDCTAEEIEKVNRWYEEIADNALHLEVEEKLATRARMLTKIRKSLAEHNHPVPGHRHLFTNSLLKVAAAVVVLIVAGLWLFRGTDPVADDRL